MPRQLVVVAGERHRAYLPTYFAETFPDLQTRFPADEGNLRAALVGRTRESRLLSFLSDLIVPAEVLAALSLQAINIHPGPPDYRGSDPDGWAFLDGAARYGATAHEMTDRIDSGRILAVRWFDLPPRADRQTIADLAFEHALVLFALVARWCAETDAPLPPSSARWTGPVRTRADFRRALAERLRSEAGVPARSRARSS